MTNISPALPSGVVLGRPSARSAGAQTSAAYPTVASVAALRAFNSATAPVVAILLGYYAAADGGGGTFVRNTADTSSADNGGTVIVDAGGNRWYRQTGGQGLTPQMFGAKGDGSTNDGPSMALLNSAASAQGKTISLAPGAYRFAGNLTFTAPVSADGGTFVVPNGVTVAVNGGFRAMPVKVFTCSGSGAVTFNWLAANTGFPEWWGATPDNASFDNAPALNAAIAALLTVLPGPGRYFTTGTVYQNLPHRNVIGVGGNQQSGDNATIIVNTTATALVWQIGPSAQPATAALFQSNNVMRDIGLDRAVAPSVSDSTPGIGLQVCYTVWSFVERVWAYQHCIGFNIVNNQGGKYSGLVGSRTTAGTGGTDRYFGLLLTANSSLIAGFYSLYLEGCIMATGLSLAASYGFFAYGTSGANDLFVFQLETSQMAYGVYYSGNGSTSSTADYYNEDVRFVDCTLDTCFIAAYAFGSVSLHGSITIIGGYAAGFAVGGITQQAIVLLSNCYGAITVLGIQALLKFAPAMAFISAVGASGATVKGITSKNNIVRDCGTSPFQLTYVTNSTFEDMVRNDSVVTSGAAVVGVSTGCSRNRFAVQVSGRSGAYAYGYTIAAGAGGYSEYNCTGIDPQVLSSSVYKLVNNGTQITAAGTFGTSVASGVMA